jgi:hypothetical protein
MKRISKLRIDSQKTITFIFGPMTVVKAFQNGQHTPNLKLSIEQGIKLYNEFIKLGAQVVI